MQKGVTDGRIVLEEKLQDGKSTLIAPKVQSAKEAEVLSYAKA